MKKVNLKDPAAPQRISVTVPVKFQLYHAPGWTHGSLFMMMNGVSFSTGKGKDLKELGEFTTALPTGAPVVMIKSKNPAALSYTLSASPQEIFEAVREALGNISVPAENPLPRKKT